MPRVITLNDDEATELDQIVQRLHEGVANFASTAAAGHEAQQALNDGAAQAGDFMEQMRALDAAAQQAVNPEG